MRNNTVKFIDLFAGLGGIRLGLENACKRFGLESECVMTSEIKPYSLESLKHNFKDDLFVGDITKVPNEFIPDFDFLLAGFPCQPFSAGGKRQGFMDTRGTLFFEIERILKEKRPYGFILENVEGMVRHDLENKKDEIGRTLSTILFKLEKELSYNVSWRVLDSIDFGVPQSRKRIYIVGTKNESLDLKSFIPKRSFLNDILENGLPTMKSRFSQQLLKKFSIDSLMGKSIKDKRGGDNNIHSWDIGLKGDISDEQSALLNRLFKERRKKHWAEQIGIDWMDGMALTTDQIQSFYKGNPITLQQMLDDLEKKGYLKLEHPKKLVKETNMLGVSTYRIPDLSKPKGYNIVTGKLSFEINKILDPKEIAPTLVATDVTRLAVPDGGGLRRLTVREGLRLFGYPEWYNIPCKEKEAFDLLGNTVVVPVIEFISEKLMESYISNTSHQTKSNLMPVCSA